VSDTRSCAIVNGSGSQSWTGSGYGRCAAVSCNATYHVESGSCVRDTRLCTIANGTGTETWTGAGYGLCTLASCNSGYHANANSCDSNIIACSVPNATTAIQTWTGTAYGPCGATACATGYEVAAGGCLLALGQSCASGSLCASGACSTWQADLTQQRCTPRLLAGTANQLDFSYVPAGTFCMGTPNGTTDPCNQVAGAGVPPADIYNDGQTQHLVTLTRALFFGRTEITQAAWVAFGGSATLTTTPACGGTCPQDNVGPYEAAALANWLSATDGDATTTACYTLTPAGCVGANFFSRSACTNITFAGPSCNGWRMPTEAEWEYGYRAGTTTNLYNGTLTNLSCADPILGQIGWYCGNSSPSNAFRPVAQKTPNALGLYDMAGNVIEWTNDRWQTWTSAPQTDPVGAGSVYFVVRGGWAPDSAFKLRASHRLSACPKSSCGIGTSTFGYMGIRLVRNAP
jgi:formylglycine-generating enzyme required for sulfatase activity